MSNYKKLTAAALAAFAIASSLVSGSAAAAGCDGSWQPLRARNGAVLSRQCYFLPTVSNGRVTGLEFKQNFRWTGVAARYR